MDKSSGDYQKKVDKFVLDQVHSNVSSLILEDNFWFENFENMTDPETERMKDVFEFWTVSHFLYRKLKARGEPVANVGSCYVWGRTCTGQAIKLDHVICEIYDDMNKEMINYE